MKHAVHLDHAQPVVGVSAKPSFQELNTEYTYIQIPNTVQHAIPWALGVGVSLLTQMSRQVTCNLQLAICNVSRLTQMSLQVLPNRQTYELYSREIVNCTHHGLPEMLFCIWTNDTYLTVGSTERIFLIKLLGLFPVRQAR